MRPWVFFLSLTGSHRPHKQPQVISWGSRRRPRWWYDPLAGLGDGRHTGTSTTRARKDGDRSATKGALPFGPAATLRFDTAFSVLEVDQMVERYEGSAAPITCPS